MRTLILATASAIALGIAGASPLYAQTANTGAGTAGTPNAAAPAAGANPAAMPPANAQTGTGMEQGAAATSGANGYNSQSDNPALAGGSQTGGNWGQMSQGAWPQGGRASRSEVRQIQQRLRAEGLYNGRIDGIDGPNTRHALRDFQQNNGLPVTGRLDQQTMASLLGGNQGANNFGSTMPAGNAGGMNTPPASSEGAVGTGQTNPPATNR